VRLAVEGHGEGAFEAVDGLVVGVVRVGGGDFRAGTDFELEERERGSGGGTVDVETDGELADVNLFDCGCWHGWRLVYRDFRYRENCPP
jgi:hypothetical protein